MQSRVDMVVCSGSTHCSQVMCKNDWYLVHNCLLGLDCITILLFFAILPEKPMPVMWQIECCIPMYDAVHDARIMDNLC